MSMRMRMLALGLASCLAATATEAREQIYDGIAAQVGGSVVLHSEVLELSGAVEERMRQSDRPESEILRVRAEALERLIEARLMEEVVRRLELGVTRAEVSEAIESIAQENGISIEQLTHSVTADSCAS